MMIEKIRNKKFLIDGVDRDFDWLIDCEVGATNLSILQITPKLYLIEGYRYILELLPEEYPIRCWSGILEKKGKKWVFSFEDAHFFSQEHFNVLFTLLKMLAKEAKKYGYIEI